MIAFASTQTTSNENCPHRSRPANLFELTTTAAWAVFGAARRWHQTPDRIPAEEMAAKIETMVKPVFLTASVAKNDGDLGSQTWPTPPSFIKSAPSCRNSRRMPGTAPRWPPHRPREVDRWGPCLCTYSPAPRALQGSIPESRASACRLRRG